MARYSNDKNSCGFFYESGTYANATGLTLQPFGMVQNSAIDETITEMPIRYLGRTDKNVGKFVQTSEDYAGTVTFYPQDWKCLMFTLGSSLDTSGATTTHAISETTSVNGNAFTSGLKSPFLSFTVEDAQQYTDGTSFKRTINGCMVDSLTITATPAEPINCELSFIGRNLTYGSGTATTMTVSSLRPFIYGDSQIHLPSGTIVNETKEWSFTVNNNLIADHYCNGSVVIDMPEPDNRDYEVSLTLDGNSTWTKTLYDQYYKGGSTFNMMTSMTQNTGSRYTYIIMSGCVVDDMEAPTTIEGINEQTIIIKPKTANVNVGDTISKYTAW